MKNLLTALLALACLTSEAQISTISTASPDFLQSISLKISDNNYLSLERRQDNISGSNWNKYRNVLTVVQYDKDQHSTNRTVITKGEKISSGFYSELLKIGSKYYVVYLTPESGNEVGDIVAVEINPDNLELSVPKVIISKTATNLSFKVVGPVYNKIKVVAKQSPSGSNIGFFIATEKDGFYIAYLDQQLNTIWQKKDEIEKVDKDDISSVLVDDQSNLYLAYKRKYKGYVSSYNASGAIVQKQIESGDNNIWDVLLNYNVNDKQIEVAGTYTENGYCRGVYRTSISQLKLDATSMFPFPEDFIKQLDKEGFANRKGLYANYKSILHPLSDGSIMIVAEMQKIDFERYANNQTGSVLAYHIGKSGAIFSKIPKYSVSGGLPGAQYFAKTCDNTLYVFYYDNPENLTRDPNLDAKVIKKDAVLVVAIVKTDGSFERKRVNFFGSPENIVSKYIAYECK